MEGDGPPGRGEAVREDVVYDRIMYPVRHAGDICSVVERKLEIFGAVIYQMVSKHIAIIENDLLAIIQFKVIEQALVGAIQNDLVIIMV